MPDARAADGLDLSCWRVAFNGAEPVRAETLERFADAFAPAASGREAFFPCYGLAEATLFVDRRGQDGRPDRAHRSDRDALERARGRWPARGRRTRATWSAAARPVPEQRVAIVDPEPRGACRPDEVGEIWVPAPASPQGYWSRPEETERDVRGALADDGDGPFLRTGDLGFLDDGELFVTGRLKDLSSSAAATTTRRTSSAASSESHPACGPRRGGVHRRGRRAGAAGGGP